MPLISEVITGFGRAYNKYEVQGVENVPRDGGALLVMYHGLVPIDFWYLGLTLFREIGRQPCALVDRWLFKTPGLRQLAEAVGSVIGEREIALKLLRDDGVLMGVSPGGVREAVAGPAKNYELVWGDRTGFAQLALDANVPIIPGFTENIEQAYISPGGDHPIFQMLYEMTRLPLVPIIGMGALPFPVKLTTWLGEPIYPEDLAEEDRTAEGLALAAKSAIEALIKKHQGK